MDRVTIANYESQKDFNDVMRLNGLFVVIGCGGIGFYAALFLAMIGKRRLLLIDGDRIEAKNLNRLPVPQWFINHNKAVALRRVIRWLRPDCEIVTLETHVTENNVNVLTKIINGINGRAVVIDGTDNAKIQRVIYNALLPLIERRRVLRYIKIGYERFNVGSYRDFNAWLTPDQNNGYRTANANAITSAAGAALGLLNLFLNDENRDVNVDLEKLVTE